MSYLQTPASVGAARELLGPDRQLSVVVPTCITDDAEIGRAMGRRALSIYLPLPAYQRLWSAHGFDASDWEAPGSDRLIDGVFNWGTETAVRQRMQALLDAGASSVIVGASPSDPTDPASLWTTLESLAPARV